MKTIITDTLIKSNRGTLLILRRESEENFTVLSFASAVFTVLLERSALTTKFGKGRVHRIILGNMG